MKNEKVRITLEFSEDTKLDTMETVKKIMGYARALGVKNVRQTYLYDEVIVNELSYILNPDLEEKYKVFNEEELQALNNIVETLSYNWDLGFLTEDIKGLVDCDLPKEIFIENVDLPFDTERFINDCYRLNEEEVNELRNSQKEEEILYNPEKDSYYLKDIKERLYKQYFLTYDLFNGNPVFFDEFVENELKSEDYINSIKDIMI